jgi:hypothetical protein
VEDVASNADSSKSVPVDIVSTLTHAIPRSPSAEVPALCSQETLSTVGNVAIRVARMLRGAKTLSVFVCRGPRRALESASTSARTAATAAGVEKHVLSDNYASMECVHDTCLWVTCVYELFYDDCILLDF